MTKVYFVSVSESESIDDVKLKLKSLIDQSNILDAINKDDNVAIKLHFGEEGNTGYVKPEFVRVICDELIAKESKPFVSDTNTLYAGKRVNSSDHIKLAASHGFTLESLGADILVPDDLISSNTTRVKIDQKNIKTACISTPFVKAASIIGVAHFKGHIMTGFGGALKNIGMGCATREGKLAQHCDVAPVVNTSKCVGCRACVRVCQPQAIAMKDDKASITADKCVGCASCIAVCNYYAINIDWESGSGNIQEKMVEYTKAVLLNQKKNVFSNFLIKITKECDCLAKDDPRISPDIGILASTDPVAIDKASFDLVKSRCGGDIFLKAHPNRDGLKQLKYANEIGLGSLSYELIKIK